MNSKSSYTKNRLRPYAFHKYFHTDLPQTLKASQPYVNGDKHGSGKKKSIHNINCIKHSFMTIIYKVLTGCAR